MLKMINYEREKRGIKKLIFNSGLRSAAKTHNLKMINENRLSHNFKGYPKLGKRLAESGIYFIAAGENIAFGSFYLPDFFHNGFMKSREHRGNILDKRFTHCGISVIKNKDGFYVTQEFANIFSPEKTKKLKKKLIEYIKMISEYEGNTDIKYSYDTESYTDTFSAALLKGRKTKSIPKELKEFSLIEILSPETTGIEQFISGILRKGQVSLFSISIRLGRNKKNPGGTYAFAMLWKK